MAEGLRHNPLEQGTTPGQPSNSYETNSGQHLNQGGSLGEEKIITKGDAKLVALYVALYELYTRIPKLPRENGNVTINQGDIEFGKNRGIHELMPELDRGIEQSMTEFDKKIKL